MQKINNLISIWSDEIGQSIQMIDKFFSSEIIKSVVSDFNKNQISQSDLGLNIFTLVSDLYYRENFHRDVIFEFLNPEGIHKQGDKYLMLFLDMLSLDRRNFQHAVVSKEEQVCGNRRIDSFIKDDTSKKAIIIENKMNNACDMPRQLPDYYNYVTESGYDVAAIVYIPLCGNKTPDKAGWSYDEIRKIEDKLHIIPAYAPNGNKTNFCDNWLAPSIINSDDIDCISTLRQYSKHLKYLNINAMDEIILERFYNALSLDNNLQTAISIRNMLNDLPVYMASRIENRYANNHYPFAKIWRYKGNDTVFEGCVLDGDKRYYKLDVWCNEQGYDIYFWNPENQEEVIKDSFKDSVALDSFIVKDSNNPNSVFLHLGFEEENKLIDIIDQLLKELTDLKAK